MSFSQIQFQRLLLPFALAAVGAGLCLLLVPGEVAAVKQQLLGFPDSDVAGHQARPWVLGALCFLPTFAGLIYSLGGTLDRYIARQFAGIFVICLAALLAIWLLMDLGDKIGDFIETKEVWRTIVRFYAIRSPAVILLLLPYSLLLALLYSLGKLSGTREVISMIQAGRSVIRLTMPLILAGMFFSLLSLGLNYQWAPVAEGSVRELMSQATGQKLTKAPPNVLYRNPTERRLWKIGTFPQDYHKGAPLLDVEVTTTHPDKTLASRLSAKKAYWDRDAREWTFEQALVGDYPANLPPIFKTHEQPLVVNHWRETPYQLIRPGLSAPFLGIPDLNSWLQANSRGDLFADPAPYLTQWHYRWALPFTCMVTVLLATPLAIHFSRRGPGGGIFLAVVLSALMVLFSGISLALGEAGSLRPAHAAWLPNASFALLGLYLFRRRITGKPIYLILCRFLPNHD